MKYLEKEVYVNQDAFNRDIHQEVEKIHEDTVEEEVVLVELIKGCSRRMLLIMQHNAVLYLNLV